MKHVLLAASLAFLLQTRLLADTEQQNWRDVVADNLVLIDVKYGQIAIELEPGFAPKHVERLRKLIRARFYDRQSFYRVVEG